MVVIVPLVNDEGKGARRGYVVDMLARARRDSEIVVNRMVANAEK